MPTILLVRHGETDWNRSGRINGTRPVPLNQNGLTQTARLALQLTALAAPALYSSPIRRARQAADILSSALHVPVAEESGLTEIGIGDWEGRHWNEMEGAPARANFYQSPEEARPPGGETLGEVQRRAGLRRNASSATLTARRPFSSPCGCHQNDRGALSGD